MNEQILMGGGLAVLSCWGLLNFGWVQRQSRYGQRFTDWFGEETGSRLLRLLMLGGLLFGTLLATNIVQPLRWESHDDTRVPATD